MHIGPIAQRQSLRTGARAGRARPAGLAARARAGQTLILFALMSLVLLGGLGLVVDVGYAYARRRALQSVADAAALKGAQDIQLHAQWLNRVTGAAPLTASVYDDLRAIAMRNGLPDPDDPQSGATLECAFVPNPVLGLDLGPLGSCRAPLTVAVGGLAVATIPATATGVTVRVTERRGTFVMRALGIGSSAAGAAATAHVHLPSAAVLRADAGPYLVCGFNTRLATTAPSLTGTLSVLVTDPLTGLATSPPQLNPAAVGQTFLLHGAGVADCGARGTPTAPFQGLNDQADNAGMAPLPPGGAAISYKTGLGGPGRMLVGADGLGGCTTAQATGCVMLLPVADAAWVDAANCAPLCLHLVSYAAFWVTEVDATTHTGTLLPPYVVQARGSLTWSPSQVPGVLVVRLTR